MAYTRAQFIAKIAPDAVEDYRKTGVLPSLTIAQGCLESSNGNSGLTTKGNNLFGIKGTGNAGSVTMKTTEYVNGVAVKVDAAFRAYTDWSASIADHSSLLTRLSRYKTVLSATDGKTAAKAIQAAGYATDPNYATLLIGIMDAYDLYKYDAEAKGEMEMTADEKAKFDALKTKVDEQAVVIAALAVRLNLNGDQTYASAYATAIAAAKAAGAITTSADKSKLELNVIQMLYNLGIFSAKKGA